MRGPCELTGTTCCELLHPGDRLELLFNGPVRWLHCARLRRRPRPRSAELVPPVEVELLRLDRPVNRTARVPSGPGRNPSTDTATLARGAIAVARGMHDISAIAVARGMHDFRPEQLRRDAVDPFAHPVHVAIESVSDLPVVQRSDAALRGLLCCESGRRSQPTGARVTLYPYSSRRRMSRRSVRSRSWLSRYSAPRSLKSRSRVTR